ncbi:hypothetical protein [Chitinophaga sancti]|uniref:JmjC domain-containing protein n=1 Tax=Chitinophaga sancti TaxID=1004 RepID=A0A1K1SI36_9BACT|nr:hypothetical protein [Chitinophaga sancti]WQD61788.1 hypothetical protein U0033_28300 [Chitinophaga sancti]WQG92643.1 hypothetical protein SR876_14085 [Chitinophaga sancti]SFW83982.1 hypothetical protein SAMN05661012_05490 [Chitinophaga sancti]
MSTETRKFDAGWWNNFLDTTENLTKTSVIKDCISREETAAMQQYMLEIIAELARLRTNSFGYRIYIEGRELSHAEMLQFFDVPPKENEDIAQWAERAFGDKKFGLIINQGERFNQQLSKLIADKLKPLIEKTGVPTEGIIFTLFVGNYDSTPLGIHLDMPGKSVIHFHLGPGDKTMYTWNNDEYLKLVGEARHNNKDLDKYLPYANKFPFEEGDLYFMPEDTYHIGTQKGLSMAIACWMYNRSNFDFATRLQDLVAESYLRKKSGNLKPDNNPLDNPAGLDKTLDLFEIPSDLEQLPFKDLLKEIYTDLRYSLHSNAGYRTSPFAREKTTPLTPDDVVELEQPYKILYKNALNGEKLHLFVRGAKIELNKEECIKGFIDEINKGIPVTVRELCAKLDPEWDTEIGDHLVSLIEKHNGVRIIKKG